MAQLSGLPNIGKKLEEKLQRVGITSKEQLMRVGSKEAFLAVKSLDPCACVNTLYALEGAVQGVRWHSLPDQEKQELKHWHRSLE